MINSGHLNRILIPNTSFIQAYHAFRNISITLSPQEAALARNAFSIVAQRLAAVTGLDT